MAGRESGGHPGCHWVAIRVFWISRGGPGGAVHGGERDSQGLDPGAREGRDRGREPVVVSLGLFEQVWQPGGAVPGSGEGIDRA